MIEDRLENWGLVMRVRRYPGRCRSIEHKYVPEKIVGDSWETKRTPKPFIDQLDAIEVETAWRDLATRKQKNLLSLHYVYRAPPAFICRHVGIQQARDHRYFVENLKLAQWAIEQALDVVSHNKKTQPVALKVLTSVSIQW
jgi:hypothetical protein